MGIDDFLSDLLTGRSFVRQMIPLKPGEPQPPPTLWGHDPPAGYRWETDAELRDRIKATLELTR